MNADWDDVWQDSRESPVGDMTVEQFWAAIEDAHRSRDRLRELLTRMGREQILGFEDLFIEFSANLPDVFVPRVGTYTEDGLADVCDWIVSCGAHFYADVVAGRATLPEHVEDRFDEVFTGVAIEVFEERFGPWTGPV